MAQKVSHLLRLIIHSKITVWPRQPKVFHACLFEERVPILEGFDEGRDCILPHHVVRRHCLEPLQSQVTHVREKHDGNLATASVPRQHTELLARERSGVYWKPKGAAAERAGPSTIQPHQPGGDAMRWALREYGTNGCDVVSHKI